MLEAEAGTAGGVDLDHAGDAERVRIGAGRFLLTAWRGRRRRRLPRLGAIAAVVWTSSLAASFRLLPGNGSAARAAMVLGAAGSARGEEVQNQTPAITTAATTLASIRPNALRIATIPNYSVTAH